MVREGYEVDVRRGGELFRVDDPALLRHGAEAEQHDRGLIVSAPRQLLTARRSAANTGAPWTTGQVAVSDCPSNARSALTWSTSRPPHSTSRSANPSNPAR